MKNFSSEIFVQRRTFDAYNVNRVYLATGNFTENEEIIFRLIPFLLHHNYSVDALNCPPDTPCGICSFTSRQFNNEAFSHSFPHARQYNTNVNNPTIITLSLIGSLGTIAQTDKSDFDYVVFLYKKCLSNKEIGDLNKKLLSIEKWAMRKLNVEVHFFLQDIDDFRENRFGITDMDNVGSAEGKLFKDEFYRTAIFVAGKRPLWWIIPPGMSEEQSEDFIKELPTLIGDKTDDYLDLGHILCVEPQEFFGAALWQINKFINSPFKSLLKMALLESYIFNPNNILLCESLKQSLLRSDKGVNTIDSYLMMCERVIDYYIRNGMPLNEVRLLQAAFLLKTGMTSEMLEEIVTLSKSELNDKQKIILHLLSSWNWSKDERRMLGEDIWGQNRYSSDSINRYFISAYVRLSDWLHHSGITINMISDKDMTVLGRRLFAYFEKKPGKIRLLLPEQMPKETPECVTVLFEKSQGRDQEWTLFDFHMSGIESNKLSSISSPVIRFESLFDMLLWAVINGFWKPGCKLVFESCSSVYNARDVEQILGELFVFFVSNGMFEPHREDYLAEKRIIKALFVPDFGIDSSIDNISIVYTASLNSWGECFCEYNSPENAFGKTAKMILFAEENNKFFNMKVVAPLSQNHHKLCNDFNDSIKLTIEHERHKKAKKKKARLDTFS